MDLAKLLVESAIAIIGLYLAHSLRRQQQLKVAEQRMASYQELWKLMEVARPTRLKQWEPAPRALTRAEACDLYWSMTHWYFGTGHGMLLTETAKKLYIATKHNLGGYAAGPEPFCDHAGQRAIHELSLLRRQMTRDLNIYGVSYFELDELDKDKLGPEDKAFLKKAGIDDPERWYRPPWYRRLAAAPRRILGSCRRRA